MIKMIKALNFTKLNMYFTDSQLTADKLIFYWLNNE